MDRFPTSERKRPRPSFPPVPAPVSSLEVFAGPPGPGAVRTSLDFDTKAGRPPAGPSTARKSPHSKPKDKARRDRDYDVEATPARAARNRETPDVPGSRRASAGGNERPSSFDSTESYDSDASVPLLTFRKADRLVVGASKRRLLLQEEDEEARTQTRIKTPQRSKHFAPETYQWKDDSNDSDYVDDEQEKESLRRKKGGDVGSDRKGPSKPKPKLAGGRMPLYRPPTPVRPLIARSNQKVTTKCNKKRGTLQVVASPKRPDVDGEGSIVDERSRSTTANRRLNEHDEEQMTDPAYSGDSNVSEDESNLSFPKDDASGSADNGMWETLGGFIDGLSGNKSVHRSTNCFGMEVIEEEFKQAKDRLRQLASSSSSERQGYTVSLAQIKSTICKSVREGLRNKSLPPDVYVRIEDPCDHNLARRTIERQSHTHDESDKALRLAKQRELVAKEAEKLQKQIDDLNEVLEREPSDVYTIHPHLRIDPPTSYEVPSPPRAGQKLQFRQAPDNASNVFFESLFPSDNK